MHLFKIRFQLKWKGQQFKRKNDTNDVFDKNSQLSGISGYISHSFVKCITRENECQR